MEYFFTVIPFLVDILAALVVIGWMGFTMAKPTISALLLVAILVAFSGATYGQLDIERTIYSRGTGFLYFSILNIYLWALCIAVSLRNVFSRVRVETTPLAKYFVAFTIIIFANALVASASADKSLHFIDAFSYNGLLGIINMGALFYVVINVFGSQVEARRFLRLLLVAIGIRGIFGMVRWALFGGDPSNVYDNVEHAGIKLTFFDSNDGFLATVAIFCSAWLLYGRGLLLTACEKYSLWGLLLLELAVLVLSFRRSSLVGLGLAAILFIAILPASKRFGAFVLSGGVMAGGITLLVALRLSKVGGGNGLGFLYDILGDKKGAESGSRTLEYTETWRTMGDYWLFGKGMWGTMQTNLSALSYHAGNFGFVHSGFGHILLKSGVFGLLLFIGLLVSFARYYIQTRKTLTGELQLLADAGAAGVLFWLPLLLIGTPVIEFRSMLMLGLALALPFVAKRAASIEKYRATA